MNHKLADRFLEAAKLGRIDAIETMLSEGMPVNACNADGETAMHRCAQTGNVALARLLLNHGIDPDVRDSTSIAYTPFMWACSLGQNEMAALLMPLADHAVPDRQGETAEEKARRYGHTDVLAMLRSYEARQVASASMGDLIQQRP